MREVDTPGAIPDPNRVAAFNPETERGIGAVDATGRDIRGIDTGPPGAASAPASGMTGGQADQGLSTNNAAHDIGQLKQVLTGAATVAKPGPNGQPPYVGQKAASRESLQTVIQQNNNGGQLSPGNAMLRGMMAGYQILLKQGRVDEANKMAYGLIQAANLEMAAHGSYAVDQMRRGDIKGATQTIVQGVDFAPDGMNHRLSANGNAIESVDPRTGKVTGTTPIDGRWILAAATGMRDGTMMWQALQAAAANVPSGRGDQEGRQLRHLIDIERIKALRLRNAKLQAGGGGAPQLDQRDVESRRLLGQGVGNGRGEQQSYQGPSAADIGFEQSLYGDQQ
jgi:hypothetical protein